MDTGTRLGLKIFLVLVSVLLLGGTEAMAKSTKNKKKTPLVGSEVKLWNAKISECASKRLVFSFDTFDCSTKFHTVDPELDTLVNGTKAKKK